MSFTKQARLSPHAANATSSAPPSDPVDAVAIELESPGQSHRHRSTEHPRDHERLHNDDERKSSTASSTSSSTASSTANSSPATSGIWVINAAFLAEIKDSCSDAIRLRRQVGQQVNSPIVHFRDARELCELLEQWRDSLAMLFALEQTYGYVELADDRLRADDCLQRMLFEDNFDRSDCQTLGRNVGVAMHTPMDSRIEPELPSLVRPSRLLNDHNRLYTQIQTIIDQLELANSHGVEPARLARICSAIYHFMQEIDHHDQEEKRWTELSTI